MTLSVYFSFKYFIYELMNGMKGMNGYENYI